MATGGITFNGSSQYLVLADTVVSSLPLSIVCWAGGTQNATGGLVAHQNSGANDAYALWFNSDGNTMWGYDEKAGFGSTSVSRTGTWNTTGYNLYAACFTSLSSRKVYYNSATPTTDTASQTAHIGDHNQLVVGRMRSTLWAQASICEVHIFSATLTDANITSMLGGTPPEDISGWVDGWLLDSASNLTSIGGTRTFTANGSPTTASLTLPYTRSGGGDPEGSLVGGKLTAGGLLLAGVLLG